MNRTIPPGSSHNNSQIPVPNHRAGQSLNNEPDGLAVWEFKRNSPSNQASEFTFSRRPAAPAYRVAGSPPSPAPASNYKAQPQAAPGRVKSQVRPQARPNRFHSGVLMVGGDCGPAPWDEDCPDLRRLPVLGEVAAGRYDVTVAYHEPGYGEQAEPVLINTAQIKVNRQTFALRVRGQSMIENEIDDGDIVIVQAQDWADDGDFVIACLTDSSDEAGFITLKRFYRQAGRVVLQPANKTLNPIHILPRPGDANSEDLDRVKIQGRVTAIIKTGGLYN